MFSFFDAKIRLFLCALRIKPKLFSKKNERTPKIFIAISPVKIARVSSAVNFTSVAVAVVAVENIAYKSQNEILYYIYINYI